MTSKPIPRLAAAALLALFAVFALPVSAQPAVPLRIVVGFPPGGALDLLARAVAEQLRAGGEEQVLVENKPGASTRISIDYVRTSAPNGRTVLLSSNAPLVIFPMTYRSLSYDVDRDFIPVAHLAEVPTVISTGADRPYRSLQDYIAWARAHPAQANVGLTSLGGALHFAVFGMGRELGLPLTPIPYKGGAPLATDLVGGHVSLSTDALASQLELHRSGKLRILAVSGLTRNAALPDASTPSFAMVMRGTGRCRRCLSLSARVGMDTRRWMSVYASALGLDIGITLVRVGVHWSFRATEKPP